MIGANFRSPSLIKINKIIAGCAMQQWVFFFKFVWPTEMHIYCAIQSYFRVMDNTVLNVL